MRKQRLLSFAALSLAGSLLAGRGMAQSYGIGDQVTTVGAAAFVDDDIPGHILDDGYLYLVDPGHFSAPVPLPVGATVTQICLYSTNQKAGSTIQLDLQAVKIPPGGLLPGVVSIPGASVTATFSTGYGFVCTGPLSYVVHGTGDVDGDMQIEHVAHRLWASFSGGDGTLGLGGVRITWHRDISPPPATATFADVPTNHPFFKYVEALYAAGITGGYGNGLYGVNDPITRGQMAVFLGKALGLHWPLDDA